MNLNLNFLGAKKNAENTEDNIVKFKKPRKSREQRRKFWSRVMAVIGVILTIGGLILGCLYSIL